MAIPLEAALQQWAQDFRHDVAVQERTQQRLLRQLSTNEARWADIVAQLQTSQQLVSICLCSGRSFQATVLLAGADFMAVSPESQKVALVAHRAVTHLGLDTKWSEVSGPMASQRPQLPTMIDAFNALVERRPFVHIRPTVGNSAVSGELMETGEDFIVLRPQHQPGNSAVVMVDQIGEASLS